MKRKRSRSAAADSPELAKAIPAHTPDKIEAAIEAILEEGRPKAVDDLAAHASPLSLGVSEDPPEATANSHALPTAVRLNEGTSRPSSPRSQKVAKAADPAPVLEQPRSQKRPVRPRLSVALATGGNTSSVSDKAAQPAPTVETESRPAAEAPGSEPPNLNAQDQSRAKQEDHARQPHRDERAAAAAEAEQPKEEAPLPDLEALMRNMGRFVEFSGKAAAAYLKPLEKGVLKPDQSENVVETLNSLGRVAESWVAQPGRMFQAQAALSGQLVELWAGSLRRFGGQQDTQTASPRIADKRFAAPEWQSSPLFDFLHQAYLATVEWAKAMVADAEGVDEATRDKAAFYLRQISSALSPSNFLLTNPELLRETFKENGENLVRGMQMLAEDIEAGNGELRIRQSDATKFKLGVNMASTPGKVVFRNPLFELIQYTPTTPDVLKRPLLIVPPWINKFYVLDLNKEKSFISWLVSQGLTVFVMSWVNPDERHGQKDWDAYMQEGIFAALDAIERATGEAEVATVGYCVGGTLLAATLAYMAAKGDRRISSSTFLTTQVDFKEAGDLKVFADEAQIRVVEKQMKQRGYLPGAKMANAFNMLRPEELIWSYWVNSYLKGKAPTAFDLLAWNADSTRMSAANHAFYLRNCYLENNLTKGEMVMGGERLNLKAVTIPVYDLAAKEDHIAPARSVFNGASFFGGPVRYVLAGSGHIAGVVNPPARAKYQYWSDGDANGTFERWLETAKETKGTWWLDWVAWITAQAPETVPARVPGTGGLPALCDAPGLYVLAQS